MDKEFIDNASRKDTLRPQLEAMLSFVREDRLARNLDDLRRLVQQLTKRGIGIEFIKEWSA